jgi:hypothetical protein
VRSLGLQSEVEGLLFYFAIYGRNRNGGRAAAAGAREQGERCVRGMWRQWSARQKPLSLFSTIVARCDGAGGLVCEICAKLHFEGVGGVGQETNLSTGQCLL